MGLDMYLYADYYVGAEYKHNKVEGRFSVIVNDKKVNVKLNEISSIKVKVGYWRKANHIHQWFVENVQDGEDDCKEHYVSESKIKDLLSICEKITNEKNIEEKNRLAQELLPTKSGFFFGGTDYDEWYFEDIESTILICKTALKRIEDGASLEYTSSW